MKEGTTKLRTGCEVLEDLGDLVERLKSCGLEQDEISEALGIKISTDGRKVDMKCCSSRSTYPPTSSHELIAGTGTDTWRRSCVAELEHSGNP